MLRCDSEYWSRQMSALLGARKPILEGTEDNFLDRIHEDDRPRVAAELDRCIHDGGFYKLEFRLVRVDGQIRWIQGYGNAVRNAEGVAERMFGILQDATERIQATHRLADSAQHTQAILDNARDGDVVLCMGAGSIGAVPGKVVDMATQVGGVVA